MTKNIPKPTRADLENNFVSVRQWEKDDRYSRLKVIVSGYAFVYDQEDKCWRRLDVPRQQPLQTAKERIKARKDSTPERKRRREQKQQRAVAQRQRKASRKAFMQTASNGVTQTLKFFFSVYGVGFMLGLFALNAAFLPSLPIVAFGIGGTLAYLGIAFSYGLLTVHGLQRKSIGLLILFSAIACVPFFAMWALHGIPVAIARAI